jgi:hypothetical protein
VDPTDSPWGALLGANAMAAANKQARVTIWKDFMVAGTIGVGLIVAMGEFWRMRRAADLKSRVFGDDNKSYSKKTIIYATIKYLAKFMMILKLFDTFREYYFFNGITIQYAYR